MAPANTPGAAAHASGVGTQRNKRTSSLSRPAVRPVLPLTYLQRRPKAVTANSIQPSSPLRTNNETAPPTPKQDPQELPPPSENDAREPLTNGPTPVQDAPASPREPDEADADADARVTTVDVDDPAASHEDSRPVTAAGAQTGGTSTPTQSQTTGETTPPDTAPSAAPSSASFPNPALSPALFTNNTNTMGPPLHPTTYNFRGPAPEPIRLPPQPLHPQRMHQHQYQQHQQHLSNGSMLFGYHGSNASSPAPQPGGADAAPMPMQHEPAPMCGLDGSGNPILSTAPMNGFVPGAMNQGPLTPHSFHGSQSSRDAAENVSRQMVNGNNGIDVGRPIAPPGLARPLRNVSHHIPFNPNSFQVDQALDFAAYISSMFARPDLADCEVVLDLPGHLTHINSAQAAGQSSGPLRLPAHQLVLSHHPLLRRMIQEQSRRTDGPREVRIVCNDPFLRADSIWRAIKYLYGFRYVPLPHEMEKQPHVEKFHFILGYAAAGARLEVPHVSITAVREAIGLLSWDTVEKGMEFALGGLEYASNPRPMPVPHAFPQFLYKHGAYVGELVDNIMVFLATNFPRDFVLDTAVEDSRYTRLPAGLFGSEAQMQTLKNGYRPSRTSGINIRFGDMEPHETNGHGQPLRAQASGRYLSTLSRLLINMPYEILKLVLESNGLGEVAGWRTVQDRRRAMEAVVAEREVRRTHMIGELAGGRLEMHVPTDGLRSKEPRLLPGNWSNVCWREECIHHSEGPVMNRVWTPLSDAH